MFETTSRKGPVNLRAMSYALGVHLALALLLLVLCRSRKTEVVIPMDLTIVPPWAQQTDDPDPDPNPPPPPQKKVELPKPQPKPEPPKVTKNLDAVVKEKVPEKKKPKERRDLRKEATRVDAPKPTEEKRDLRSEATKVIPKVIPPTIKTTGKATAADKPMSPEEFMRKMMEGYRIGSRNQIADNEVTRCISLIVAAIRRECERDSFKYHQGMVPVQLELSFGPGGRITGYRILVGSGDGAMDQLVLRAVGRLGSIGGLSAPFLQQYPRVGVLIEPLQR